MPGPCGKHMAEADKARGTQAQRGYGIQHQRLRARWKRRLDREPWPCARCGLPILTGQPWDLGHADDRKSWTGPEHQACNRATAGRTPHS